MNQGAFARHLAVQFERHVALCYGDEAAAALRRMPPQFRPYADAIQPSGPGVIVPIDIEAAPVPQDPVRVPFGTTELTLWNPLPAPAGEGWRLYPGDRTGLWWRHRSGTLVPRWNLFGNVGDALTLREDRESPLRDAHGRVPVEASPRLPRGLTTVPVFNEAVAAVVAANVGMLADGVPRTTVETLVRPPLLMLSHDCDALRGDDRITQAIRVYRALTPLAKARLPAVQHLAYAGLNLLAPHRFYTESVFGMLDVERQYGYRSTWYILNGTGGRFGARTGDAETQQFVQAMQDETIGLHYNYDTLLAPGPFIAQKRDLERWAQRSVTAGRAHYLRFDALRSPAFLASQGMVFDESVGWSNHIGFRAGIAGVYEFWDSASSSGLGLLECPLTFMDSNLSGRTVGIQFQPMLEHLRRIGGVISILWHPGTFANPEFPELRGVYNDILRRAYAAGCRSLLPADLRTPTLAA